MKKIFLTLVVLLTGMVIFAQTGTIREISGTVEIKPAGAQNFIPAGVGVQVNQDTVISTGFRSNALVAVGGTIITVRPLTRLTLLEISILADTETVNVNLQAGRVRVDVNPPAGARASTTVSSPIATASVRGTSFSFDGQTLGVREGIVYFQGSRGSAVTVKGGSVAGVSRNGRATDASYTGTGSQSENDTVADGSSSIIPPAPGGSDASSGTGNIGSTSTPGNTISASLEYPSDARQ